MALECEKKAGVFCRSDTKETVGHPFVLFYLVYITFVVFATLRVVTAVFLRDTLLFCVECTTFVFLVIFWIFLRPCQCHA